MTDPPGDAASAARGVARVTTNGRRSRTHSAAGLTAGTRLEAFSDGVLAIVVTLLALDLKSPIRPNFGHFLAQQWPAYVAYLVSFLYVGVIWVNHHYVFSRIARVDAGILWRNLFLLLAASVLPFPTAVVSSSFEVGNEADRRVALVLYASIAAMTVVSWLLMFHYLSKHPELLSRVEHAALFRDERLRALAGLATYLLCVVVALASPDVALGMAALVPIFYAATSQGYRSSARRRNTHR